MEAKNERIINTAIEIFSQKGFTQTTMQDIAEKAGVGKGTIYRFFQSKDDLVSSLIELAIEDVSDQITTAIARISDPVQKLRSVISVELDYYDEHRDLAKFLVREIWGYQNKFLDHIKKIRSTRAQIVERIILQGIEEKKIKEVNPQTVAASLEGMILASAIYWFMFSDSYPKQQIQEDIFTLVFPGLLA